MYRQLAYSFNSPSNIKNKSAGWLDNRNFSLGDVISGKYDDYLPIQLEIGRSSPQSCNCNSITSKLTLNDLKKIRSLKDPQCRKCHPIWNKNSKKNEISNDPNDCPRDCGGKGVPYIIIGTKNVAYFRSDNKNSEVPLKCIPAIVYDDDPTWRNDLNPNDFTKDMVPAKKLVYLPPDKFGFDTKSAVKQYCQYESDPNLDRNNRNIQQPNRLWYSENNYPRYPGSCDGLGIELNNNQIPNTGNKGNTCGKPIFEKSKESNIYFSKADNKGLKGKEPKCCKNFISQGTLPEKENNFESPLNPYGPDDYTKNKMILSQGGNITFDTDPNDPSHSRVASYGVGVYDENYIWKPSFYQLAKTDYKFSKKDKNGLEIPISSSELISKTSDTGLNSIGHVFLNDYGLVVNSNGKCCDPSLYNQNNDGIVGNCGTECEEMNIVQPIDHLNDNQNEWRPKNTVCNRTGYSSQGISECTNEASSFDNNERDAKQMRAWLMSRTPRNANISKNKGQIRTCVNKKISNKISNVMSDLKNSKKILDGDNLGYNSNVMRDSETGKRVYGKYGLSDIIGNILNKEYQRNAKENRKIN